jgi:biotin-(acetyl-CoA carboxylase) ligase
MTLTGPSFPPLFHGMPVAAHVDPFSKAIAEATLGCDSGLIVYAEGGDTLRAAIVFAPERPLDQAMAVVPACGVGFQNALGALAPPEVAVHLAWTGEIFVNGARCGGLTVAASHEDGTVEPNWIVVGLQVPVLPLDPEAPGATPEATSLFEEGCADVDPVLLLEAWARHTLVRISALEQDGPRALHAEWRGLARDIGEPVTVTLGGVAHAGTFLGVDEDFGMLLRAGDATTMLPQRMILTTGDM